MGQASDIAPDTPPPIAGSAEEDEVRVNQTFRGTWQVDLNL